MKWRSTVVLLVVACGLGLYLYFFERARPAKTQQEEEKRRLVQLSADDIDRLRITHGEVTVALERESAPQAKELEGPQTPPQWRMTGPVEARASGGVCDQLARDLASLDWGSRLPGAAEDSQKLGERGLAPPRALLSFRHRDKEETLEFGDDTPLGDRVYLRRRGGADLYEVRKSFFTSLLKDPTEFRDTTVLSRGGATFPATDVEKFSVSRQGERLVAERKERRWQLATTGPNGFPAGTRADRDKLEEVFTKLARLRVERFVADAPDSLSPEALTSYGLAMPVLVAEVEASGKPHQVSFGGLVPEHPDWRYARTADGPSVYAVRADVAEFLARPFLEFRDRRLTLLTADRVETLTVALPAAQEGGEPQTVELVRKAAKSGGPGETGQKSWRVSKPRDIDADEDAVRELLRDVDTRTVLDFVDFPKAPEVSDLAAYGLDKPRATLTFAAATGEKEVIQVGSAAADGGRVYLRRDEEPTVLAVNEELARLALRGYLSYRTKKLTEVKREDVTRIRIERPGGVIELTKEKNDWQLVAPVKKRAERTAVDDLLFELTPLRGESIVAEEVTDLSAYGLDTPAYRLELWSAKEGEKPQSTVVSLGVAAPEGGRFARLASEGLVATLPQRFVDRLDAEFRQRTVFSFERDKVEELTLKGVTPEVVAVRVGGAWQLRQPEGQPLDEAKVIGLLDELKNLRVQRWVTYEAAELSPYGLDQPVAVVSVELGGLEPQTHTMAFGGEAEGGDVFARVEEDPGVFLLPKRLLEKVRASLLAQPEGEPSAAEPKPEGDLAPAPPAGGLAPQQGPQPGSQRPEGLASPSEPAPPPPGE